MTRQVVLPLYIALFASLAFAHGNEKHVIGTVTQVTQDSVTVLTTAKAAVQVNITPDTKFTKGTTTAALTDLKVGDRVVIHAMSTPDGKLMAHTVQIGAAKAPPQSH
jgi:hypothetical protein